LTAGFPRAKSVVFLENKRGGRVNSKTKFLVSAAVHLTYILNLVIKYSRIMIECIKFMIEKELPSIQKNISLAQYTTFKIGGKARYFFIAKTKEDLIKAISFARKSKIPFFILGGGSNLLVSDKGYKGLVIKMRLTRFLEGKNACAEAGVTLNGLVRMSLEKGLSGMEWAAGIPGTVGGAIYGNAGAFGKSMKDNIEKVEVLDIKNLKVKSLKNKDCKFGYRESVFKKNKNLILISATLKLKKGEKEKIKELIEKHLEYRKTVQPLNYPSAGSVFKNTENKRGLTVGKLIEECGLKGKKIGRAKISEKHANFIVNLGGAKEKDVKKLINLIKRKVKSKFKIVLEEEVQFL